MKKYAKDVPYISRGYLVKSLSSFLILDKNKMENVFPFALIC